MFDSTKDAIDQDERPNPIEEISAGGNVYSNEGLRVEPTNLSWGTVDPSRNTTRIIVVRNLWQGTADLGLSTFDWVPPEAANYLSLTWDYDGKPLEGLASLLVNLTLTVSSDVVGKNITDFDFKIRVSAEWG